MVKQPSTFVMLMLCMGILQAQEAIETSPETSDVISQITPIASEPALPDLEVFVDGLVKATMAEHKALPGITISIVKDGEIVLLKGYGLADVEKKAPVDPERSMFRIGSITKTFTGLAVMQLVEQGMLDLDEDVNTYLKAFKIPDTFESPVTLRSLLSHRAGFEDSAAGHLFEHNADELLPLGEYLATHMPQRVREPGLTSTYSNYGLTLAGYIVEVVSGQDYASYVEQHIFRPLNMNHSTVREPLGDGHPQNISAELERWLVTGYAKGPDGKPNAQPFDYIGQVGPAGSISSSALDMARYMMARLKDDRYEGGRLLEPQTTAQMRKRLYNDRPRTFDMAHAMADAQFDGYYLRWHNGGTMTFFSDMTLYPELQLGIFISTNSSDGGSAASGMIPRLIFEYYYPSKLTFDVPEPPADFTTRGRKYAGHFMPTRRSYTQLEKIAALSGTTNFQVDDKGYLLMSAGGQQIKWAEIEPGVFQAVDADPEDRNRTRYLYFYEDENGVPVRVSMPVNDLVRISFWQSPVFFFLALGVAVFLSLTTLLGAWRRAGRGADQADGGKWAFKVSILAAIAVLAAAGGLGLVTAAAASDPSSLMFNWPPGSLRLTLYATLVTVVLAVAMILLLRAVWSDGGWGLWRRVHYTLFAVALVVLLLAFNEWNLVGFKYF